MIANRGVFLIQRNQFRIAEETKEVTFNIQVLNMGEILWKMCGLVITLYGKFTVAYGQLTFSATRLVKTFFYWFLCFCYYKMFQRQLCLRVKGFFIGNLILWWNFFNGKSFDIYLFQPIVPFLYIPRKFTYIFRGCRKVTLTRNALI